MVAKWSFERLKSFPETPYEELFQKCEQALLANALVITRLDASLGIIEARKGGRWPFKSERIFITVRRDSKVTAIEKSDMSSGVLSGNVSPDEMISAKFFKTLKEMTNTNALPNE